MKQLKMFTTKGAYRSFNYNIKKLIKQGQNDKIKSFMKGMAPLDLVDSSNTSLLHLSARYNNHDLTKHLIKMKCNVNATSALKLTPLMVAASNSSFKTAQILIEANADIYATNSSNKSALQLLLNNKKVPLYLINCCFAKLKSDDPSGEAIAEKLFSVNCPLHVAIHLKKPSITRQIINSYGLIDPQKFCAAMDLAFKLRDKENVSVLLQCGAEVEISNSYAIPFLHSICGYSDGCNLELINAFLEKVSDWNSLGEEGLSCLDTIIEISTKQEMDVFLRHNVNDYVKNKFPGHDLIVNRFGHTSKVSNEFLKPLQFNINSLGKRGLTALHFTADICDVASARMLLELGANPNATDNEGHVPLYYLDKKFYTKDDDTGLKVSTKVKIDSVEDEMAELLVQAGADPQLIMDDDVDGDLMWYEEYNTHMVQILLAQLAINASMGAPIKETVRQNISRSQKVKNLYKTCSQQLDKLKEMKVYGSTTLYTMLVTDVAKLVDRIRDREALQAIGSGIKQFHFYYASKLKNSANRILRTMDLREKASAFICETTGWPNSQYIVLEKILGFLTYKDLLAFD